MADDAVDRARVGENPDAGPPSDRLSQAPRTVCDAAASLPAGLGEAGSEFWAEIASAFDLEPQELAILTLVARQLDDVARLEALIEEQGLVVPGSAGQPRLTPVLAEVRQARLAATKMIGSLALPSDETDRPMNEQSRRARQAANARWAKKRAVQEQRARRGDA